MTYSISQYVKSLKTINDRYHALTGLYNVNPWEFYNNAEDKQWAMEWLIWHIPGGRKMFFDECDKLIADIESFYNNIDPSLISILAYVDDSYKDVDTIENTTKLSIESSENVEIERIEWKSNNPDIATINSDGFIKGITSGTVTITAIVTLRVKPNTEKLVQRFMKSYTLNVTKNILYTSNGIPYLTSEGEYIELGSK